MPPHVSLKLMSLILCFEKHLLLSLWSMPSPAPASADWLFCQLLIAVLQYWVSSGSVTDVRPGEDGATVRPKSTIIFSDNDKTTIIIII